jgi:hypothetical protein
LPLSVSEGLEGVVAQSLVGPYPLLGVVRWNPYAAADRSSRSLAIRGGVLMPAWVWVVIAAGVVVVLALLAWHAFARRRTGRLQEQFGPEYDRMVGTAESRGEAEAELQAREERREQLEIRPLSSAARYRFFESWQGVQAEFVDDPRAAVSSADGLIRSVMAERGYPVEDFEQRAADLSVDHPKVVENYRQGHRLAEASVSGGSSTEDLRQAMRHYRALFDELVEPDSERPLEREASTTNGSKSATSRDERAVR